MRRMLLAAVFTFGACGGSTPSAGPTAPTPTAAPVPATPTNIAGTYTLTIQTSSVCTQLPSQFRTRTYVATITQSGANFAVNLTGNFAVQQLSGTVSGTTISAIGGFVEETTAFGMSGELHGTVSGSTISATLNGSFFVGGFGGGCNATDHRFTFTRR